MIGDANADNRAAIEHYGNVAVLGEMPRFDPLTPESLRTWARDASEGPDRVSSSHEFDRDRAVLWHPYTQMLTAPAPLPIARAEGV